MVIIFMVFTYDITLNTEINVCRPVNEWMRS